jgi:hypothetical protein
LHQADLFPVFQAEKIMLFDGIEPKILEKLLSTILENGSHGFSCPTGLLDRNILK